MKKLLSLLASFALIGTSAATVISCGGDTINEIETVDENDQTKNVVKDALFTGDGHAIKVGNFLVKSNTNDELKKLNKSFVDEINNKLKNLEEKLIISIEGTNYELRSVVEVIDTTKIKAKLFEITNSRKVIDVNYKSVEVDWKELFKDKIIALDTFKDKQVFLAQRNGEKSIDARDILGLLGNYSSQNIMLNLDSKLNFGNDNKTKLIGTLEITKNAEQTDENIFVASENKFEKVELNNVYNSTIIYEELINKQFKINMFANGTDNIYDYSVYGISPTSLHDAFALHSGDQMTGDYVVVTDGTISKSTRTQDSQGNKIIGKDESGKDIIAEIHSKKGEALDDLKFDVFDAKTQKLKNLSYDDIEKKYEDQLYYINYGVISQITGGVSIEVQKDGSYWLVPSTDKYYTFFGKKFDNTIDQATKKGHDPQSMLKYNDANRSFSTEKINIFDSMKSADNAKNLEEAKKIGNIGDAFNWGRNNSGAHNLADYFNKYVADGEHDNYVAMDGTKIYPTYKRIEVKYGSETMNFVSKGNDPFISDQESQGYWGYKNQGLRFKLESNNTKITNMIVSLSMEQFKNYYDRLADVKGDLWGDIK